ncbi:MAG: transposase [Xanthomonadales bacterium]|nr:transposase [Xanthomonadales bacterium]
MELRQALIEKALTGRFQVTELAHAFGVSRKTAHKWIGRHREGGMAALADRSHARLGGTDRVSEEITQAIIDCRARHPTWGPKKIAVIVAEDFGQARCPAVSTIGAVLKREGLVDARRRLARVRLTRPNWPQPQAPNEEWAADYKGQWRLGDGSWTFPLTISDSVSRYLLCSDSHSQISTEQCQRSMIKVFSNNGLPCAIRTDRGIPFASHGRCMSLTKLSIWWLKLGIELRRIQPGKPTQNACHERMHRVLKAEAMLPVEPNQKAQQARFDVFRRNYNDQRPHESLAMKRPAQVHLPSKRQLPSRLPPFDYPAHVERYRVRGNGTIPLRRRNYFVSEALAGEIIGLEQHATGWKVFLGSYLLADIDDEHFKLVYLH